MASPGDIGLLTTHGSEDMHGSSFCRVMGDLEFERTLEFEFEFNKGCDMDPRATGLLRHT